MTPEPNPVRYATGCGRRTHIVVGEQLRSSWRGSGGCFATRCGGTVDAPASTELVAGRPLCKLCERSEAKANRP